MKIIGFTAFALCVVSGLGSGATLDELIIQNLENSASSTAAYSQPQSSAIPQIRLWVHVRNSDQLTIGDEILTRVASTLPSLSIEKRPIQVVTQGPLKSQLRFFTAEDKYAAQEIVNSLIPMIGEVEIQDFVDRYKHVAWIKPGHIELWLSPDVSMAAN